MCPALETRPALPPVATFHQVSPRVSKLLIRAEVIILTTDACEQQQSPDHAVLLQPVCILFDN